MVKIMSIIFKSYTQDGLSRWTHGLNGCMYLHDSGYCVNRSDATNVIYESMIIGKKSIQFVVKMNE